MFRESWVMFIINGSIAFVRTEIFVAFHAPALFCRHREKRGWKTAPLLRGEADISVRTSCPSFLLLVLWAVCPRYGYYASNSASSLKLPRCEVALLWILVSTQVVLTLLSFHPSTEGLQGILVITEVVLTFLPFTTTPVFVFPERLPIARAPSFLGIEKIIPQRQNVVKFSWGDTPWQGGGIGTHYLEKWFVSVRVRTEKQV